MSHRHNILIVNEFSDVACPVTRMVYDLGRELDADPNSNPVQINLRTKYRPGGTQLLRVVGLIAMQLVLPVVLVYWKLRSLLRKEKLTLIVTTLPPLIHMAGVLWGRVFGIKTIVWYQDAHPEIEVRLLKDKGFRVLPEILRSLDRWWLTITNSVVALDASMKADLERKFADAPVSLAFPWITYVTPSFPLRQVSANSSIRLFYAGNYGFAHDLSPLHSLLRSFDDVSKSKISVTGIGMNDTSSRKFKAAFEECGVSVTVLPRAESFLDVCKMMPDFDFGIVSLHRDFAGIACPSKAFTYLSQGLPILYVGPKSTLSDHLVEAGWGLDLAVFEDLLKGKSQAPSITLTKAGHIFPDPKIEAMAQLKAEIERVHA